MSGITTCTVKGMVYNQVGCGPIRSLSGADYWKVYWETFLCHYDLWTQGVHHRDISDGNLMYKMGNDGQIIGVLADFDLSSLEGKASSNSKRTGSVPFMALDLLSDEAVSGEVAHDYCHDAEAFFWVGVYDTACYDVGRMIDNMVSAKGNLPGVNAMREKRVYYQKKHNATSSQNDVWKGLRLLMMSLVKPRIFERPKEPNPEKLPIMQAPVQQRQELYRPSPFGNLLPEPEVVRDNFLKSKRLAEQFYPSLLQTTSAFSS